MATGVVDLNNLSEGYEVSKAVVQVISTKEKWHDATYKEDKPAVVAALKTMRDSGIYLEKLWEE